MTSDWTKPDLDSTKGQLPGECIGIATSAVKLDPTLDTNIPVGAMYYNRSTKKFQEWSGAVWANVEITNLADGAVSAASKIADGIITAAKIVDGTLTYAKAAANEWTKRTLLGMFSKNLTAGTSTTAIPIVGGFASLTAIEMPVAVLVTHISITAVNTGGFPPDVNIICDIKKNASAQSQTVTISSGDQITSGAIGTPVSFAAGDNLGVQAAYTSLVTATDINIAVWGIIKA